MYTHETYGPPAVGTPNTWDVPLWNASIEKIRMLATHHSAFMFPGHDETGVKVRDEHITEFEKSSSILLSRLLLRVEEEGTEAAGVDWADNAHHCNLVASGCQEARPQPAVRPRIRRSVDPVQHRARSTSNRAARSVRSRYRLDSQLGVGTTVSVRLPWEPLPVQDKQR